LIKGRARYSLHKKNIQVLFIPHSYLLPIPSLGENIMNPIASTLLTAARSINAPVPIADIERVAQHLENPSFRIAVFAPFNHGKSTLLNALLGNRTLPIALIPTTGTAIVIKYGAELRTCIRTQDGQERCGSGTSLLQEFAVLDHDRQMRGDVESVEVYCPHPLLEKGIELVDLPGTDDMNAQDDHVYQQLLTVDSVIPVLDARKLMTLGEVNRLQDWLLNRGIDTALFVLNFMNLLEVEDQKEVIRRAQTIVKDYRGDVLDMNNLYRVDALPALRAKLKGDRTAAIASGVLMFESALYQVFDRLMPHLEQLRLLRLNSLIPSLEQALEAEVCTLEIAIRSAERQHSGKRTHLNDEITRLAQAFQTSLTYFKNWLSAENLVSQYQAELATALQNNAFEQWQTGRIYDRLISYQATVTKPVHQACDRLGHVCLERLTMTLPDEPSVDCPISPDTTPPSAKSVAIATGVGWLIAGPIGGAIAAGITHAVNASSKQEREAIWATYQNELAMVYEEAAEFYLEQFSDLALAQLDEYASSVELVFIAPPLPEPVELQAMRQQLNERSDALSQLRQQIHTYGHTDKRIYEVSPSLA
jgi:hypothetical protein